MKKEENIDWLPEMESEEEEDCSYGEVSCEERVKNGRKNEGNERRRGRKMGGKRPCIRHFPSRFLY